MAGMLTLPSNKSSGKNAVPVTAGAGTVTHPMKNVLLISTITAETGCSTGIGT